VSWEHDDGVTGPTLVAFGAIVAWSACRAGFTLGTIVSRGTSSTSFALGAIVAWSAGGTRNAALAGPTRGTGRPGCAGLCLGAG
jgi:hypothetical protein